VLANLPVHLRLVPWCRFVTLHGRNLPRLPARSHIILDKGDAAGTPLFSNQAPEHVTAANTLSSRPLMTWIDMLAYGSSLFGITRFGNAVGAQVFAHGISGMSRDAGNFPDALASGIKFV